MAGKSAPKLVGLDIGASGIRAVELKRDRKTGDVRDREGRVGRPAPRRGPQRRHRRAGRGREGPEEAVEEGALHDAQGRPRPGRQRGAHPPDGPALDAAGRLPHRAALPDQRRPPRGPVDGRARLPPARREPAQGRPRRRRRAQPHPHRRRQHGGRDGGGHGRAEGPAPARRRRLRGLRPHPHRVRRRAADGRRRPMPSPTSAPTSSPSWSTRAASRGSSARSPTSAATPPPRPWPSGCASALDEAETIKRETGLNGPAPVVTPIAESSVFVDQAADEPGACTTRGSRPRSRP